MSNEYSIAEIVRFAVEIEKEGAYFYNKVAQKTEDSKMRDLCTKLEADEINHQNFYTQLLDGLGEDKNEYLNHLEDEYTAYLHSVIEKIVFDKSKVDELITKLGSEKDIIKYAITKEEGSITFYEKMKKNVISEDNASVIDKIINEEKKHIQMLEDYNK